MEVETKFLLICSQKFSSKEVALPFLMSSPMYHLIPLGLSCFNKTCYCRKREREEVNPDRKNNVDGYHRALALVTALGQLQHGETLAENEVVAVRMGLPAGSDGKESASNSRDLGWVPGLGRTPGGENGYPLHYSFLENPKDRGAW